MKTAILLSGYFRIYNNTFANLKRNIVDKFGDCDFYIHTWDKIDGDPHIISQEDVEKLYNPRACVLEPYFDFDISKYPRQYGRGANVLSMWYKLKKVFELSQQSGEQYDLYVRMRTDHLCLNSLDRVSIVRAQQGFLVFPSSNINKGVNDQFCIANKENMSLYCSLYDNIDDYYNEGLEINPELLLAHHLKRLNIKTCQSPLRFVDYTYNNTQGANFEEYYKAMKDRHPELEK